MSGNYYLDTNICIAYLRNPRGIAATKISSIDSSRIKIPAIVKAELMSGAMKSARPEESIKQVADFCMPFEMMLFDEKEIWLYAKIRSTLELKGQKIGHNDTIIAATVLANNGILITNNTKEFSRVDGLMIEDWTQE